MSTVVPADKALVAPVFRTSDLVAKLISAGTAACVAEAITLPLDCTKIKLQVGPDGPQNIAQLLLQSFWILLTLCYDR